MRFEVRYPSGSQHEVELSGSVAVMGRDPSCDLVLNDAKCSRRHAVLEAGPQGMAIRDAGSANGIFVNGKKVERANLVDGDVVRLGEVIIKVLPEEVAGTLVMAAEEIEAQVSVSTDRTASVAPIESPFARGIPQQAAAAPPVASHALPRAAPAPPKAPTLPVTAPPPPPVPLAASAPLAAPPPQRSVGAPARPVAPPPRASQQPRPAPIAMGPAPRPLTLTALAVLWLLGLVFYPVAGLGMAAMNGWRGLAAWAFLGLGVSGFFVSALMAYGLWTRSSWARPAQIAFAGLGLLTCLFSPAAGVILFYMLREETGRQFSGRRAAPADPDAGNESLFTLGVVGATVLPFLLAVLLAVVGAFALPSFLKTGARPAATGTVNLGRMRAVAAAEQAFSSGTCGAFADIEGLLNPASIIPNYPATGPAFLATELAQAETAGYRYELQASDPVPASEGCPARSYRRFVYTATPAGGPAGRHYIIGSDGVIRAADDRPATPGDPPVLQ